MASALTQLFSGFLLAKEAEGVKETTLETYRVMYRSLIASLPPEAIGDMGTLTTTHLHQWIVSIGHYAPAIRHQRISKAKSFLAWCHANGYLDSNPAVALKRPKKNWQPDSLTEEELTRLLDYADRGRMGIRNMAIVCVLLDCGIRNTELCHLEPDDVSLKTGQVRIQEGKGGKPRVVLIGKRAKDALWRWMMIKPEDAPTLFCTARGKLMSRTSLQRIVSRIGERAGVRAFPHRLRHTFALQYLKLGGDAFSLQYILGHEDMSTVREYVKVAARDVEDLYRSPLDALEV